MMLNNVRLRYESVFEPSQFDADSKLEYSATVLVPADHPQLSAIEAAIDEARVDKFGKKKVVLKHVCLRDAGEKSDKDGFEDGDYFIKAGNTHPPSVFDADKTPLVATDRRLYAGCWVDVSMNFYAYDNKFGKGVSCSLRGIRLRKQDDAFGGSAAQADEFEDIPEEEEYEID